VGLGLCIEPHTSPLPILPRCYQIGLICSTFLQRRDLEDVSVAVGGEGVFTWGWYLAGAQGLGVRWDCVLLKCGALLELGATAAIPVGMAAAPTNITVLS
jgi:hypothetical protein